MISLLVHPSPPLWGLTADVEEGHLEVPAESLYEDSLGETAPSHPCVLAPGRPNSPACPLTCKAVGIGWCREAGGSSVSGRGGGSSDLGRQSRVNL